MHLFLQSTPADLNAVPFLQWGALGALVLFILVVFFYLIPGHNQTVREVVKDNRDGLEKIAAAHERTTDRICAEIKSCRMEGRA